MFGCGVRSTLCGVQVRRYVEQPRHIYYTVQVSYNIRTSQPVVLLIAPHHTCKSSPSPRISSSAQLRSLRRSLRPPYSRPYRDAHRESPWTTPGNPPNHIGRRRRRTGLCGPRGKSHRAHADAGGGTRAGRGEPWHFYMYQYGVPASQRGCTSTLRETGPAKMLELKWICGCEKLDRPASCRPQALLRQVPR